MHIIVGKPINGISINGKEYLCDNEGNTLTFKDEAAAMKFLADNGMTEEDIDALGIIFEECEDGCECRDYDCDDCIIKPTCPKKDTDGNQHQKYDNAEVAVRYMLKHGSEHTTSGNYHFDFDEIAEKFGVVVDDNFISSVESIVWDKYSYMVSDLIVNEDFDFMFYTNYCPMCEDEECEN